MADKEVVNRIYNRFSEVQPGRFFEIAEKSRNGMHAVIQYLDCSKDPVSAGNISSKLKVSTARVAVLLKNLETKGYIKKAKSKDDARVTLVELTEAGKEKACEMKKAAYEQFLHFIDTLGEEKLMSFCDVIEEMQLVMLKQIEEKQEEENA